MTCPSSSCSAASSRASSVSGLRTAPPNEPECRSPAGPRRSIWPSVMPAHAGADGRRLARPHAGVGDHDDVGGEPVAPAPASRAREVRRAGLLLALDEQLEVDRRGWCARSRRGARGRRGCGRRPAPCRRRRRARAAGRRRRSARTAGASTASSGVDRLHVVVAVDERRSARRRRRWATRRRRPAGPRSPTPRRSGSRCRAAPAASHSADRRTSGVVLGIAGDRGDAQPLDQARDHVVGARGHGGCGRRSRCRSSCAEPYDRRRHVRSGGAPRDLQPAQRAVAARRRDPHPGPGRRGHRAGRRRRRPAGGRPPPGPVRRRRPDGDRGRGARRRGGAGSCPSLDGTPGATVDAVHAPRTGR